MFYSSVVFCFFFQAEDGIRDGRVTGVQTCALPILLARIVEDLILLRIGEGDHGRGRGQEARAGRLEIVIGARPLARAELEAPLPVDEIGRASCRERVWVSVGAVASEEKDIDTRW